MIYSDMILQVPKKSKILKEVIDSYQLDREIKKE